MKYILDVDASKVIEAVRSTGVTITPAMMHYAHVICSGLKSTGMWQNSVAIYGFVGGTANSHRWNWKDLRDVDAAFRLTYTGVVNHTNNGINSTTGGYADTKIIPNNSLVRDSVHLSINSYNDTSGGGDIGCRDTTQPNNSLTMNLRTSNLVLYDSPIRVAAVNNESKGIYIGSRTAINLSKIFKNSSILATGTGNNNFALPSEFSISILAQRNVAPTQNTNKIVNFSSIGAGLTDAQAIGSSQIITQAQAILNRA